jgi:uncharacterized protein (UPF0147 family)
LGAFLELVKLKDIPYETRKEASEALMALAALTNNYPILLRLSIEDGVPMNIGLAADEKSESVALSALKDAHMRSDAAMIAEIAADKRLPAPVREQADVFLVSITKKSIPPAPTKEMAADAIALSRSKPPMAIPRPSYQPGKLKR